MLSKIWSHYFVSVPIWQMNIYIISERGMRDLEKWEMFMKFNRYKARNKINIGVKKSQRNLWSPTLSRFSKENKKYWGIRERYYRKMHCNTQHS